MKKILGFWEEYRGFVRECSLQDETILDKPQKYQKKAIEYLKKGIFLGALRTIVCDAQDGTEIGVPTTYTDGKWVWTTEYIYFIEKYNLKIKTEFLDDIKRNDFTIPSEELIGESRLKELENIVQEYLLNKKL